ncbi:MAG TPA: aminotransferase class I and II [Chloroflexi bacterium]|nr:aminotransferase class I and II [Chloroflexota bacterium]
MLKHLEAVRYLTPLREGGSLPAIVETDEPSCYVVKFRGAGQGPKALIAELVSGELARAVGLPVPEIAFIEVPEGFGRYEPNPEIQDLLRWSEGLNLGLCYLPGSVTYDPVAVPDVDPFLASAIVWFDAYVTNVDRTPRNTNMLIWQGDLYLIDHGSTLYFHHNWEGYEARIRTPFPAIRNHVLLPVASEIEAAGAMLSHRLSEVVIRPIVDLIPATWLEGEKRFAGPDEHRQAYIDYLLGRLEEPRAFVEEIKKARNQG